VWWTDHRTSQKTGANVAVKDLEPAMPQSKGQECIVLGGLCRGKILLATKVAAKKKIVTLSDGADKWDEPFDNVCVVEMPS
jgi:hypothetical protein